MTWICPGSGAPVRRCGFLSSHPPCVKWDARKGSPSARLRAEGTLSTLTDRATGPLLEEPGHSAGGLRIAAETVDVLEVPDDRVAEDDLVVCQHLVTRRRIEHRALAVQEAHGHVLAAEGGLERHAARVLSLEDGFSDVE